MSAARVVAGAIAALGIAGCADLPPYPDGCGNSIVESGEECDGTFGDAAFCRPPGAAGACRFDCSEGHACPSGYGCGADAICRRPSGAFEIGPRLEGAGVLLSSADADSDGRDDLVRTSNTRFALEFFEAGRTLAATADVAGNHPRVTVADLTGDGRAEVAARRQIDGSVSVFRVADDRALVPLAYSATAIDDSVLVVMDAHPTNTLDELVFLLDEGIGVADTAGQSFIISSVPTPIVEIVGTAVADLVEDASAPCEELVVARLLATHVPIYTPCRPIAGGGAELNVTGAGQVTFPGIDLPPDAMVFNAPPLQGAPRPAVSTGDLNGDGHLDVVIATFLGAHVAYGVGDGTFHSVGEAVPAADGDGQAVPLALDLLSGPGGVSEEPIPFWDTPLAIADFNADGAADYVTSTGILISERSGTVVRHWQTISFEASQALAGDFNVNGAVDVAVTTDPFSVGFQTLGFYNGAGDGTFVRSEITAPQPVTAMARGDFDGDLVADLVFVTPIEAAGAVAGHLSVSFGTPFGQPQPVRSLGAFEEIVQLLSGRVSPDDTTDDVIITTRGDGGLSMAVLVGNADRELLSPIHLVHRASLEVVVEGPCAARTGTGEGRALAVLALPASSQEPNGPDPDGLGNSSWLLRFDADGRVETDRSRLDASYRGAPAAVDLNDDGVDELVLADGNLRVLSLDGGSYQPSEGDVPFWEVVGTVEPIVSDVDADGRADVTFRGGLGEVIVLWNDGTGALDPSNAATLVGPPPPVMTALEPQSTPFLFYPAAWIQADVDPELELVMLDLEGITLHDLDPLARAFAGKRTIGAASSLTFAAARGDFDGDGVDDLAIGDDVGHQILWGVPESP